MVFRALTFLSLRDRSPRWRLTVAGLCAALGSMPASAQNLDDAVNEQLERQIINCQELLNGDPAQIGQLTGELVEICQRPAPAGNPGSSDSAGGAAGTPASRPAAVRQRLDEDMPLDQDAPLRGFFLTLSSGSNDRDVTAFQDGYQGNVDALLAGFDRVLGPWVAGLMFEHATQDGDFFGGGDFDTTSDGFTVFGSRAVGDATTFDLYAGLNDLSNDRIRAASFTHEFEGLPPFQRSGLPAADFDASQTHAGMQFTHRVSHGSVTFGPKIALDWSTTDIDTYTEVETVDSGLALTFYENERTSLVSTIGLDASFAISTDFGVVVLSEYLYWKHEHDDKQRTLDVSFVDDTRDQRFQYQTDPPDEEFIEFGVDVIFVFQGGFQAFVAYEQTASHSFLDIQVFSAGIRKEF